MSDQTQDETPFQGVKFTTVKLTDTDERFYFAAACLTFGFELSEFTPGLQNVYDRDKKVEQGAPGDCRIYLPVTSQGGIEMEALVSIWRDPTEDLTDAEALRGQFSTATTFHDLMVLSELIANLQVAVALAHIRAFSLKKFAIHEPMEILPAEKNAIDVLDSMPGRIIGHGARTDPHAHALKIKREFDAVWDPTCSMPQGPAMAGWVKYWIQNYLEIRNLWRKAPRALKIDRGEGRAPLVIPEGKNFNAMLERWT